MQKNCVNLNQNYYNYISELTITNFRNYKQKKFEFTNSPIVIYGDNGLGKTNILEAISLLSPGRGIRNANLQDITNKNEHIIDSNLWTIYAKVQKHKEYENIATALQVNENSRSNRIVKINQKDADKSDLNKIFNLIWLSPQDDQIFIEATSVRRKFLDRIVYCIDPTHSTRISLYERTVRERIKILTGELSYDAKWIEILEQKIAALGTEIAHKRNEALSYLNKAFQSSIFPKEHIYIEGEFEKMLLENPDLEQTKKIYITKLAKNRTFDANTKRTNIGTHKSDLKVIYKEKNMEAKFCSTGEQKSLLISLTLAKARMCKMLNRPSPILLLDEISSHLDDTKRAELFHEIISLNTQCFLTGTNAELFKKLKEISKEKVSFLSLN
jgi:DNA replication and repair protein RecF